MNFIEKIKAQEGFFFRSIESFFINGSMLEDSIKAKTFWRFRTTLCNPIKDVVGRI